MAENRTFKFIGQAYGATPVSLTATVAGETVFSGSVNTINEATPIYPPESQVELFSFTSAGLNTDFAGNVPMTVTVTGGNTCIMGEIQSNFYMGNVGNTASPNPGDYGTSGGFELCFFGSPNNSETTPDPRSSVKIDGVTQVPPEPASRGCWNWYVPSGSTLSYNFNVDIGMVGIQAGNTANYTGPYTPVPNWPATT